MDTILVSSGFMPNTLAMLRKQWHVVCIDDHAEALVYLQHADELPMAIVVGRAVPMGHKGDELDADVGRNSEYALPAHVMLEQIQRIDADLPVIISTGERSPAAIVPLAKSGAFDYIIEPEHPRTADVQEMYNQALLLALHRAVLWRRTLLENRQLKEDAGRTPDDVVLHARSGPMLRVLELLRKVAPTPATVLVTGESGSGKELVARYIHHHSNRSDQPFVAINCGALSDALLTSELFGHVKGAFTGADANNPGLIRQAAGGTLFLDEIATVSPAFQVTLLRVLEQRMARPVGGQAEYPVQCRFIAAGNRDIATLVREGKFREDLYYRLNVFHIEVPSLRKRREDIPGLAHFFLNQAGREYGKAVQGFDAQAMETLETHDWPGNVRELRNAVERAVILCEADRIGRHDLVGALHPLNSTAGDKDLHASLSGDRWNYHQRMRNLEVQLIRDAVRHAGGNLAKAARLLGLKRTTLYYRMQQLDLDRA